MKNLVFVKSEKISLKFVSFLLFFSVLSFEVHSTATPGSSPSVFYGLKMSSKVCDPMEIADNVQMEGNSRYKEMWP